MNNIEILRSSGLIEYKYAITLMEMRVNSVFLGEANELLWLLEHSPIYTLGSAARDEDISHYNAAIPAINTGRGGKITYHGPGQRVIYLVVDLRNKALNLHNYVRSLELWAVNALCGIGISASTKCGFTGVWLENKKIASIGVRVRKWIAFHGIAINVNTDLSAFTNISPCGLAPNVMTSIHEILGSSSMDKLDEAIVSELPNFLTSICDGKKIECI